MADGKDADPRPEAPARHLNAPGVSLFDVTGMLARTPTREETDEYAWLREGRR